MSSNNKILLFTSKGCSKIALPKKKQETSQQPLGNCTVLYALSSISVKLHVLDRYQLSIHVRLVTTYGYVNVYQEGGVYIYSYTLTCRLAVVFMRCLAPRRQKLEHQINCIFCATRRIKAWIVLYPMIQLLHPIPFTSCHFDCTCFCIVNTHFLLHSVWPSDSWGYIFSTTDNSSVKYCFPCSKQSVAADCTEMALL